MSGPFFPHTVFRLSWRPYLQTMNVEQLREFCLSLPHATEDVKLGNDLCFCIGGKMFCVTSFSSTLKASLKVTDKEFEELSTSPGIVPASYMARHKWIYIQDANRFNKKQWEHYVRQSYELVRAKLPKKVLEGLK